MNRIETFVSRAVVLDRDDIDTDQIIPARFLTTTGRSRLGEALFADWRYDESGDLRSDFPLNQSLRGAAILIAGRNFGCGSSREHAVWALQGYGLRAVISPAFADIFRTNALGNGLLPITLEGDAYGVVLDLCRTDPEAQLEVDLAAQTLATPAGDRFEFPIDPFSRHCLLHGTDALGFLLAAEDDIARYELARTTPLTEAPA
jgi:3-isopropylmalate/(R)-2-methylmalate dehydratase small subunit